MDSIDPIAEGCDEAQSGEEVAGGFVVACGDGPEILHAAEGPFDDVAQAVEIGVEWKKPFAVSLVGDDRCRAACLQEEAQMIRVIAFVANQLAARRRRGEQGSDGFDVGDVAAGQQEGVRTAVFVDERVDFRRAAAARPADGLILRPLFLAPLAERRAFTVELSIIVSAGGSPHSTSAAKMRRQSPRWLQRLYRLKTVVYGPYSSGSARQRQPSRKRWMTRRSPWRSGPVWTIGRCSALAARCASLSQKLSATNQALLKSLNHDASLNSIGYTP